MPKTRNQLRSNEAHRRRKRHEPPPNAGVDEPFGPPPIEYLYRCSICGTELLVNEAIIDVGIGMAKFHQAYHEGFMPKVGCPGCSGDTMEYIDED